jgi:WD40 repeat protein
LAEIFISYASADAALAACVVEGIRQASHLIFRDSDREDGIPPGAAWQETLLRKLRHCSAVVFLNSTASRDSKWCHSELMMATALGKRIYSLDLAPELPSHPLLQSFQGIRFEATLDDSIQQLVSNLDLDLDSLAQSLRFKWKRERSPYPGLERMDVDDAGVFFGREDEVRSLVARVSGSPGQAGGNLVPVMGPSGAGKSSLVRAGLVARLAMPRSGWVVAGPFDPWTRPLDHLANRLAALVSGQLTDGECRDRLLNEGIGTVGEWLTDHLDFPAKRLLITVDQAEQLATITPPQAAEEFLAVLERGLRADSPTTVVMTFRSDRFDEMQQLLTVVRLNIHTPFVVDPMRRSQLTRVIEGPAERADLTFAPGLVNRLIDDAVKGSSGEAVDALPLLAFTLREMYVLATQEGRESFTDADYERVGEIEGAIKQRTTVAESLLPPNGVSVLEDLLPRFVTLSEDHPPAGRPVPRYPLTVPEQAAVQILEDQRLLTGAEDTVRLAHEQLITAWPLLARTVAKRRDDLLLQARLERQAKEWKRGTGGLLGRDAADTASKWLKGRAEPGTDGSVIGDYIRASDKTLRRRRRQLISTLSIIMALAVAASAFAVVYRIQRSSAVLQSHLAQSEGMAAEAVNLFSTNAPLAMLLSVQAYERAPTMQARSALIEAAGQPLADLLAEGSNPIASVAFSPDGRALAAGDGGDVGIWDTRTGRRIATLAEGSPVYSVAFSPDGRTLAIGDGGDVRMWDIRTGRRIATLAHGSPVHSVAFSPDGRRFAVGDYGGHVSLWNTRSGRRIATLAEGSPVYSVAFSPDGRMLAVADGGGRVSVWDIRTGRRAVALAEGGLVHGVAFSPDGRTLAAGDYGGHVSLWDTGTGRRTVIFAQGGPVHSVAFSPDGRTLAAGDYGGHVSLWDTGIGRRTVTLAEGSPVYSVAFSPDGRTLAAGDYGGRVGLWDTGTGRRTVTLAEGAPVYSVAFSPDGRTLAAGDYGGHVSLWDIRTGRRTITFAQGGPVNSVAFSPDGQTLAIGGSGGHVGLWDIGSGQKIATLAEGGPVNSVAFSPDGRTLAAADGAGHIGLWDTGRVQRTATLADDNSVVAAVAFSPDGRTLAVGDYSGRVGLWDTDSDQRTAALIEGGTVYSVAFSPDGRTLAVGDRSGDVGLWDIGSGQKIATLAEGGPVNSVAFSPDGRTLAAADGGGDVGLWDTGSVQRTATVAAGSPIYSVAFSPNGQTLAVGDLSGNITLLRQSLSNLTTSMLSRLICREVRTNMTHAQWQANAPGQPYKKTCPAYP